MGGDGARRHASCCWARTWRARAASSGRRRACERFGPLRVVDTPIAEGAIAGVGHRRRHDGAAAGRRVPVRRLHATRPTTRSSTRRPRSAGAASAAGACPVVFRAPFGAGVGGGLYHSQSVEALYCHLPGLKVVVPATAGRRQGLLKAPSATTTRSCSSSTSGATGVPRGGAPTTPDEGLVPIGVGRIDRPGGDVSACVTYGVGVHLAREAADVARGARASTVEILDLRTLAPLDRAGHRPQRRRRPVGL